MLVVFLVLIVEFLIFPEDLLPERFHVLQPIPWNTLLLHWSWAGMLEKRGGSVSLCNPPIKSQFFNVPVFQVTDASSALQVLVCLFSLLSTHFTGCSVSIIASWSPNSSWLVYPVGWDMEAKGIRTGRSGLFPSGETTLAKSFAGKISHCENALNTSYKDYSSHHSARTSRESSLVLHCEVLEWLLEIKSTEGWRLC